MGQHNDVGALGEQLIYAHLMQAGPVAPGRLADLSFAGGVEIEVKTSRATHYNRRGYGYQFCVAKRGHTNFRNADVLVLVCIDENLQPVATYVIPTWIMRDRKKITIPRNLSSPWNVYRERWSVIIEAFDRKKGEGDVGSC